MNLLDRTISYFSPVAAFRRLQVRKVLASYEAGQSTRLRKFSRDKNSANTLVKAYAGPVRDQARYLDRNHDLSRGALNVLVNNIIGPSGIGIEPQPRRKTGGSIHEDLALMLQNLWRDWSRYPEVTYQLNWPSVQRVACRTWLRDGEAFAQVLEGSVPNLDHRTRVPFSLELLEPDMVPHDLNEDNQQQGIILNGWGQPVGYRVYKVHPGDAYLWKQRDALKTIESERIAAKIAASMAAFIKKGTPDLYELKTDEQGNPVQRDLRFQPGMVFDDLQPGEEIGTIDTNRPNTNLQSHRDGQLRAAAAGFGASYSSISRNYNGTYSAQRQELVEQWTHYQSMADHFVSQFVQPIWERFVVMARMSGQLPTAWLQECEAASIDDALFISQTMPWIDPAKEASANEMMEANLHMSGPEIIRRRGGNPQNVLDQQAKWIAQKRDAGLMQEPAKPAAKPVKKEDEENV